jgi:outer membrane protein OmpA-like peptidoglycan-associated protein
VFVTSRSWARLVGSGVLASCLYVAAGCQCGRQSNTKPQASASVAAVSSVPAPHVAAVKQTLAGLKTRMRELRSTFVRVRTRLDAIPPGLDRFAALVQKLDSAEKVLGVTDAKVQWLSGRLDAALGSSKAEELASVASDINGASEEVKALEVLGQDLSHELVPYERTASLLKTPYTGQLPDGQKIVAAAFGVEQRLIEFIQDPKKKPEAATWFDFDPLLFPDRGGKLDVGRARDEIENVARILAAYPKVKLVVGAYPDDTGPIVGRRKLPTERTLAVKAELIRLGIEASRLESGTDNPELPPCIANVEGSTCLDKTGRVAIRVIAK